MQRPVVGVAGATPWNDLDLDTLLPNAGRLTEVVMELTLLLIAGTAKM
jgi:rubredoxin